MDNQPSLADIQRAICAESLGAYAQEMFPGMVLADHHQRIICALRNVEAGLCKRLLITAPPRHSKSLLVSEFFPAWALGRVPSRQIICATYGQELSRTFGRRVKTQITDDRYQAIFPGCRPLDDSSSADLIDTTERGRYVATSIGGSVTGKGANCFPAGTMIETNTGQACIEDIIDASKSIEVLSYDHRTDSTTYQPVRSISIRERQELYRITTSNGRVVEATGGHPVFVVGKGYIRTDSLAKGDRVLCLLREGDRKVGTKSCASNSQREKAFFLFRSMRWAWAEWKSLSMLGMWRAYIGKSRWSLLFGLLQKEDVPKKEGEECGKQSKAMRSMRENIQPLHEDGTDVLEALRGKTSLSKDEWFWKPYMEGQRDKEARGRNEEEKPVFVAKEDHRPGWALVRRLPIEGKNPSSPCRFEPREQHRKQYDSSVRVLPCVSSQRGKSTEEDTISMVERTGRKEVVYNLQVEKNENFFAGGLLIHNCLIIDDPVKDREEAESSTMRDKTWDWYTSVARTRLQPGGAIIIMQTRWHEDDLTGRVIAQAQDSEWDHLHLPAIDDDGRALWPEWFSAQDMREIRREIGTYDFEALYQGRPVTRGGGMMQTANLGRYDMDAHPPMQRLILAVDTAAKTKDHNDYSVIALMGKAQDGIYVLGIWRQRAEYPALKAAVRAQFEVYHPDIVCIEDSSAGVAIIQELRLDGGLPIKAVHAVADKVTRATPLSAGIECGRLKLPTRAPWLQELETEMGQFPSGKHDDQVDALALGYTELHMTGAAANIANPMFRRQGGLDLKRR